MKTLLLKLLKNLNNVVQTIFIQLEEQRRMYQRNGEMIEIDGTYKTNLISMKMMIEDSGLPANDSAAPLSLAGSKYV